MNKLILGTAQFGSHYGINNQTGKPTENETSKILDLAQKSGILFLDTAEGYGDSQKILGNYFRQHPQHSFKVLTKFSGHTEPLGTQLRNSLAELDLNKVYAYSFHRYTDIQDSKLKNQLQSLKGEGLISKIGVSIYNNEEFKAAIDHDFIYVIQIPLNLLDNWAVRGELIKRAKSRNKEIHARSVFLQGLFYKNPTNLPLSFTALSKNLQTIHEVSSKEKIKMNHLALRYVLSFSEIDRVLIGVETLEQLEDNLMALSVNIPQEVFSQMTQINVSDHTLLDPRTWK